MNSRYPASIADIPVWARANNSTVAVAKRRYAQYGVLRAIAGSNALRTSLVFKGGNALDFMWSPNRSTLDLDFSSTDEELTEARLKRLFEPSLQRISSEIGTLYRVQSVRQHPPGKNRHFITFAVSVGYAHPDDANNLKRMNVQKPSQATIPVEISLNEPICDFKEVDLDGDNAIQVSTMEDIVAEKLRALLQQIPRNRMRPQDVLDIAVILKNEADLQIESVADFLHRKAAARSIEVSKERFEDAELWRRAEQGYAELESTARVSFIPFTEAKQLILAFVKKLNLDNEG